MNVTEILTELRSEREGIQLAILSLERLTSPTRKRRGRPPKWMAEIKSKDMQTHSGGRTASMQSDLTALIRNKSIFEHDD
jgi:hypothetical protein